MGCFAGGVTLNLYKASDLSSALKGRIAQWPCKPGNGEGSVACLKSVKPESRLGPEAKSTKRELIVVWMEQMNTVIIS
jgi:hypothetical protein